MKFSIITPTYRRRDLLERAIKSVLSQTYTDWEMIIVNDSPDDPKYQNLASSITDPRIRYYVNDINSGVNYSRNRALDNLSRDSAWVVFLDDDDYFVPDALAEFNKLITAFPDKKWFMTNRAYADGILETRFRRPETQYSFIWEYLILKRGKGEMTQCISTKLINGIRFSKRVKQGEEWLFYYQIELHEKMYYHNHNSTLTDGYDEVSGLNFRKRSRSEQFKTLLTLIREGNQLHLLHHPTFLIYLFMRLVRLCIKTQ
ncbi:MAG: glycosyltransferase family 2 protein [Candidatus Yonathbacteria bacterium]|nr:glycosyltransferase family 2 protein [Candidatus Yonathbacteria bacterium]